MCEAAQGEDSEGRLIRRLQGGDMAAFDILFERFRRELLAFVVGLLGDRTESEDVVQECFLELTKRLDRIDAARGVKAWLYRVARNRAIDRLRKRKWSVFPGSEFFRNRARCERAEDPSPGERVSQSDRFGRLRLAMEGLPLREREVLTLRYFSDLGFREIAGIVGRPLGTVLWQARRGVERLRAMHEEADDELF